MNFDFLPLLPRFVCWEIHPCCCLATMIWSFLLLYNVHHMNIPQLTPFTTLDGRLSYLQMGKLWLVLLWTFFCMSVGECVCVCIYIYIYIHTHTFLLDVWLEVELVDHRICVFSDLILLNTLPKKLYQVTLPMRVYEVFVIPCPCQHWYYLPFSL